MDLTVLNQAMAAAGAGAGGGDNPNAWDISKAYYDAGADAWDISKAFYSGVSKSVSAQDGNPAGIYIKPDGTKLYVVGDDGDDINEYDLSTPWLISSASYVQNFSVSGQETNPQGISFKPDGTKMYVIGFVGDDVNEYDLSTAWDISSASYLQNFSVASQATLPNSIFFKPDGTKFYITNNSGTFYEYSVSTPWDISTSSYVQSKFLAQDSVLIGTAFSSDGTKLLTLGNTNDKVFEYTLSSAWDISTATYTTRNIDISFTGSEATPSGLFAKPDGSMFYVNGRNLDTIWQYVIGGFSVAAQETTLLGLSFKADGTKMYVIGSAGDDVNEYDLSSAWDITTASYLQNFSVAGQESSPQSIFFKPDGTKMYVAGNTGDDINEYDLSSAWDVSTASYVQNFSVSGQDTIPQGVFFSSDGIKMYMAGSANDNIYEYTLSSAWNISTASYVQNFSVSAQDGNPSGVFFETNGTKMYVSGLDSKKIYEYSLSSAWDISTATLTTSFQNAALNGVRDLFWKNDGTQFFYCNDSRDAIFSFLISPT